MNDVTHTECVTYLLLSSPSSTIIVTVTTTSNQIFKDGLKPTKMSMVTALI